MKVLFHCHVPFSFAHGGMQVQIEQTKAGLEQIGVEVEFFRWWDDRQKGDLIHFCGIADMGFLQLARAVHMPVVMQPLLTGAANYPDWKLALRGSVVRAVGVLPMVRAVSSMIGWTSYGYADHVVVGLQAEKHVLQTVYAVDPDRISVIPLGLSDSFLRPGTNNRSADHLICVGTITRRKNCVTLAKLARAAQVPILFVGKPYAPEDPHWLEFRQLIDDRWVKHHAHVFREEDLIQLLRNARGFVMTSAFENWCLAAHEAAACGLPLLLPDQKWSRERFGSEAHYLDGLGLQKNVPILRRFYDDSPHLPPPSIKLYSWVDVARQFEPVYRQVLSCASH